MKLVITALVCLLVVEMWLQEARSMSLIVPRSTCCYKFVRHNIPRDTIECYIKPSLSCSHKEVLIFKLKQGAERCVSTKKRWVKARLANIDPCPAK